MARVTVARLGLAAGAALALTLAGAAQAQTPTAPPAPAPTPAGPPKPQLTVAQRMQLESIGEVVSLPGGRFVFEQLPPYRERIGYGIDDARAGARVMVLDPGAKAPRPLFRPDPKRGYEIIGVAPSGGRLVVRITAMEGTPTAAVVDVATGRLTPLQYAPYGDFEDAGVTWLSDDTLAYSVAPADRDPVIVARLRPAAADTLRREWSAAFEGKRTTADVLRSRPAAEPATPKPGQLVVADARTGRGSVASEGLLLNLRAAPSRSFVAGMRRGGLPANSTSEFRPVVGQRDLMVAGVSGPQAGKSWLPCADCDVLPETVIWDAAQDQLYFYARKPGQGWEHGSYYRYTPGTAAAEPIDAQGQNLAGWIYFYTPGSGEEKKAYAPIPLAGGIAVPIEVEAPVHDVAAIVAAGPYAPPAPVKIRWVLLKPGAAPRTISGDLKTMSPMPIAFTPKALYVVADGKVWRLSPDADPVNLTPGAAMVIAAQPLRHGGTPPLLAPSQHGGDVAGSPDKAGLALVQRMTGMTREYGYLDLDGGAFTSLGVVPMEERVVAASGGPAVVIRGDGDGVALSRLEGGAKQPPFLRLNTFLSGVGWPKSQQIRYKLDGHDLQACVTTDPAAKDLSKRPIVVYLYPLVRGGCSMGAPGGPSFTTALGVPEVYSPEFLAGLGYTVVFPAAPAELVSTHDEALAGFSKLIDVAVDEAGKEGLGDASRVGLFGISQGGFSVLKTLTESGRYKAAVAGWSASDYASDFASFGPVRGILKTIWSDGRRMWYPNNALAAHSVPWEDPDWYVRSSSYFNSAKITTPLLMVQSDLDANFPMNQFDELFTALYIQHKDVDYVRYWGEGHGLTSPANIEDFAARVKAFFAEKLGPGDR
ncbi:prolyl oligopeptidase family serine peptidase [Sphingomonas sp.]|uniref:alpha/beta hydrolase family protein n=1 Tax=Sphingomonas sp. TaxID=28214 RepID=UPI001B08CB3F|nr:prolyl oligopeptidase family serine peptidase [Sphingomonas sp.]MBO9713301.1 prolyl oligopeptidase family serine peptidase [Sphingomonas sp.]